MRLLVGIIMAVFVIPYITVQAIGFGLMLTIGTEGMISYELGAFILTIVAMLYCVMGGQRATAWTDVLQGVWMYAAIWIVAILIVQNAVGGIGGLISKMMEVKPELLVVSGKGFSAPLNLVSFVILFGIALPICMQHLQMKFYTARDPKTLRWMSVPSALYLSSIYIPAVFTGLTAAYLIETGQLPPVSEIIKEYGTRDALLPLLAVRYAPAILVGFLFAGAIAAAMSTLDNFNIATSVVITNDIYRKGLGRKAAEKTLVNMGRVIIVVFSLLGWVFAVLRPGLIFDLVAMSVAGVAQFLPAVIAVTYPTREPWLTKSGASAGIIAGVIVTALLLFPDRLGLPIPRNPLSIHAGVWGLVVNFVIAILVSLFTKPPSKETINRIHGYLDEVM
jgi:SSS family solute:Na+ symporter